MARYIDADALIEMCKRQIECEWNTVASPGTWSDAFQDFSDLLEQTPTADVAPKSEVAREIFDEIYKTMNLIYSRVQHDCVGRHGDDPHTIMLVGKLNGIKYLGDEIAELKKKYTEEDEMEEEE